MTREEAIRVLKYGTAKAETKYKAIDMAIKTLSAEPCDDAISRKDAIFALNDAQVEYDENYKGLGKAKEIIDSLPSVQPIRPKGEWIFQEIINAYYVTGQCSRCNQRNRIDNFCPNCGADMRGEENG